jgi:hypothetical protein
MSDAEDEPAVMEPRDRTRLLEAWDRQAAEKDGGQVKQVVDRARKKVRHLGSEDDPYKVTLRRDDMVVLLERGEWPWWDGEWFLRIPEPHLTAVTYTAGEGHDADAMLLNHVGAALYNPSFGNDGSAEQNRATRIRVLRFLLSREEEETRDE